jgi:beta-galactosidase
VPILLPDGTSLAVPLARHESQAVVWCLFNASLGGRTTLDYSNLSTLTLVGRVLVCFGPEGADAHLSIGGGPLQAVVPGGRTPTIVEHEGITVVICNEEQVDQVFEGGHGIYLGVSGIDAEGKPIGAPHSRHATFISAEGKVSEVTTAPHPTRNGGGRLAISRWEVAETGDYTSGGSARFASIPGPGELAQLGSPYGMGWYRIKMKPSGGGRATIAFPGSGDRLHVFLDGEAAGVAGLGAGAERDLSVTLRRSDQTLVVLAENFGRVSAGSDLGGPVGVTGHAWHIKPLRGGKPALRSGEPLDVLGFRTPLWEVHAGDLARPDRITWTVRHRHKTPILMTFREFVARGVLLLNNQPLRFIERGSAPRVLLDAEVLSRGVNMVQVALLQENVGEDGAPADPAALLREFARVVSFHECVENLTEGAEWAFARWEPPTASHFHAPGARRAHGPAWWRAVFTPTASDGPLFFEPAGLTKGQLYVNGKHLGRYFAATPKGRSLPHEPLYVPRPWLTPEAENAILIFDEHAGDPSRARLVYQG